MPISIRYRGRLCRRGTELSELGFLFVFLIGNLGQPHVLHKFSAPQLLTGPVFAGILAAIMSTTDSFVNIGSAAVIRDIPRALGRKIDRELAWGRIAVFGIALLAAGLAYLHGDLIVLTGTFLFRNFGAALAPALAIGLNWRRVTAAAAVTSMSVGIVSNIRLEILARAKCCPLRPVYFPLPPPWRPRSRYCSS